MTCWGGNASKQVKTRLDKNMKKAGWMVGRGQESKDTACHRLVTNKPSTILAGISHPLRPDFDNLHTDRSDRFRVLNSKTTRYLQSFIPAVIRTRLHDICSHSFQRSFEHDYTISAVIHSSGHSDKQSRSRQMNTTLNGYMMGCGDDETGIKWKESIHKGVN